MSISTTTNKSQHLSSPHSPQPTARSAPHKSQQKQDDQDDDSESISSQHLRKRDKVRNFRFSDSKDKDKDKHRAIGVLPKTSSRPVSIAPRVDVDNAVASLKVNTPDSTTQFSTASTTARMDVFPQN
ncbi:hypothetical protein BGZ54_003114, partial [Gamsiella multidivaricata]